jgi:hypothetical protein
LEPVLQVVKAECRRSWAFVGSEEDQVVFTVQAYANDMIFISKTVEGIEEILRILE